MSSKNNDKVNTTIDELEDNYIYFINDKITKNESIYSHKTLKKNNKGRMNNSSLRNYSKECELAFILNNPHSSLDFNKTMIISHLKPILEEHIDTNNYKPERHLHLPNIKLENNKLYNNNRVNGWKSEYSNVKLPKNNKSLELSNSSILETINELSVLNKFTTKEASLQVRKKEYSFKKLTQRNNTIVTKKGSYIFKSNYRLKKYLITIKSNNYNVNHILESYICKRMSLTLDIEEWTWYNFKYHFSFHIKYKIDTYGNTFNYSVFIKYAKNKVFNIDNILMSYNISHLDREIKGLFINILEGNHNNYWQLSSIQHNKNTKYITYALLAPLQYYRVYLQNLESNMNKAKYNKFCEKIYYYGNLDIDDEYFKKKLRDTVYNI